MEVEGREYIYDGKFQGNILIVGRTGCGKATFIQKLGKIRMFGEEITDVFWVSKIRLTKERERAIGDSFEGQEVHFSYTRDIDNFDYLIDNFAQDKSEYVDDDTTMGENLAITCLNTMDDVSSLADKSEEFSNFLTVSRKYGFTCLYVFHTIYPGRQSWEMIMSQMHIFNFFHGLIHSSRILGTLSLFASQQKNTYVPNQQIWLNRLYFHISNSKEKKCLTIDTREVNDLGPGKFRTSADDGHEQTCYFNRNKSDKHFTSYVARRTQNNQETITFSIVKVNSDFALVNKSLDIEPSTSLSDGISKGQLQQSSERDLSNGSKTTESTTKRQPRVQPKSDRSRPRGEFGSCASRKKPKFLD